MCAYEGQLNTFNISQKIKPIAFSKKCSPYTLNFTEGWNLKQTFWKTKVSNSCSAYKKCACHIEHRHCGYRGQGDTGCIKGRSYRMCLPLTRCSGNNFIPRSSFVELQSNPNQKTYLLAFHFHFWGFLLSTEGIQPSASYKLIYSPPYISSIINCIFNVRNVWAYILFIWLCL